MDIIELPLEFIGIGEVKGDLFKQRNRSPKAYIYERKASDSDYTTYEIFKRKVSKESDAVMNGVNVHFEAKVKYPRSEDFGVWAWYYDKYDDAVAKFIELSNTPDKIINDEKS